MATAAVTAKGTKLAVKISNVWRYFAELKTTPAFGESVDKLEASSFDSEVKEYIKGLPDSAEDLTFTMNAMPTGSANSNLDLIEDLSVNGRYEWRVEYPLIGKMVSMIGDWSGSISGGAVNTVLEYNLTIIPTSKPIMTNLGSTYTMAYDANTGTGTMTDVSSPYNAGATVTTIACTFTKTGKNFLHWNTRADNSGLSYDANDTFAIYQNTTLYAIWSD